MAVSQTAYFHAPSAHSEHASILECESNPKFGVWDTANEEREGRTARMSDRPMRLKYLTKMKIILCIFLLCITAVSVFGEPQKLNGIVGQSVKFPAAVKTDGNLTYSGEVAPIGEVTGGSFTTPHSEKFSGRVQWNSSTGLFSLSALRLEDSGEYTVQNTHQDINTTSQLNVYTLSVFGELNGIVGKSIEFPAAVKIDGSLRYSGAPIGDVISGRFTVPHSEKFNGRVQRDSSTGLFSLSGLKMEDSGVYTVQNTQQNINTTFQLNVYKDNVPVSKPNVIIHYASCTIECTAERGTGVTLSWYREGEEKPYVSSRVASAPYLHLTVESGTYTCEVKNSVSNEKASITVGDRCTAPSGPSAGTIVAIIIAVVAVLIAVVLAVLYRLTRSKLKGIRYEHAVTSSELKVTSSELKVTRSELEDLKKIHAGIRNEDAVTRSELEVIRSELEGLRGPAKGNEKPKTKKGCATS